MREWAPKEFLVVLEEFVSAESVPDVPRNVLGGPGRVLVTFG